MTNHCLGKRKSRGRAFSLTETLAVVAVVAVLAGILLPVLARARGKAGQPVAMSNLRQCYVGLSLYASEEGFATGLPDRDVAWTTLGPDITRDPADHWRKGRERSPYEAMVGSFGYANSKLCTDPVGNRKSCVGGVFVGTFPLLISIFDNDPAVPPGDYLEPKVTTPIVMTPQNALTLWGDGHVRSERLSSGETGRRVFSWAGLFQRVDAR